MPNRPQNLVAPATMPDSDTESRLIEVLNALRTTEDVVSRFAGVRIHVSVAADLIAARDALPGARFQSVDDLLDIRGIGPVTLEGLLALIAAETKLDRPILLFPVRLETRFVGAELRVRIFPDQILLDSYEPRLTRAELAAGRRYHAAAADGHPRDAWRALAQELGPARAAWVARRTADFLADDPPDLRPDDAPWLVPPRVAALPHHFVLHLYRDGALARPPVPGSPIASPLTLLGRDTLFDHDAADWTVDFDAAEAVGMGIRVTGLTDDDLERGFSRVVVTGTSALTAPEGQRALERLLDAHHYTTGLGFVPWGTPTNNTETAASGHSASAEDREGSYDVEVEGPAVWEEVSDPRSNAQRLGRALGLGTAPEVLRHIAYAAGEEDAFAREMQTALWPATGDDFLRHLLNGVLDDDALHRLADHFVRFVRASGPLPTLRVGTQPYGVLPVVPLSDWQASPDDNDGDAAAAAWDAGLHRVVSGLHPRWHAWALDAERVPRVRRAVDRDTEGYDPDGDLLGLLAMEPLSSSYRVRPFVAEAFVAWLLVAMRSHVFGPGTAYAATVSNPLYWVRAWAEAWRELRTEQAELWHEWTGAAIGRIAGSRLLHLFGWWNARDLERDLELPLVGPGDADPTAWLRDLCRGEAEADATSLLHDLLRRSLDLADNGPFGREAVEAAICRLAGAPVLDSVTTVERQPVDRLFAEALDLCTNRLDAWITSLATKRLDAMRRAQPDGLYLGAYGYLEALAPRSQPRSAGFVHAPSQGQAAAAAVLRSAYLTHAGGDGANPFRLALDSNRVRDATRVLEGVRQGQPLGALLGQRLERELHERGLDRHIDTLRRAFPLVANKETHPGAGESVYAMSARNVVDGLALIRWRRDPGGDHGTPGDGAARLAVEALLDQDAGVAAEVSRLFDAVDGVNDVLIYESLFHAAQGNYDRAGAAIEAASGQLPPPALESLATPVRGKTFSQRVCLLLADAEPDPDCPRSIVEPRIAAWAAELFGPLSRIGCGFAFDEPRIDVNTAAPEELARLPGIDDALAAAIATHRDAHEPFRVLDELTRVTGVDAATVERLRRFATTGFDHLSVEMLGLHAVDLLYLSPAPLADGQTELEQRIHYWVRREHALPADVRITVDASRNAGYDFTLEEALELGRQAVRTLGMGAPLRPDALGLPSETADSGFTASDVAELDARLDVVVHDVCELLVELGGRPVGGVANPSEPVCGADSLPWPGRPLPDRPLSGRTLTRRTLPVRKPNLTALLFEAGRYGSARAIPRAPGDALEARRADVVADLGARAEACQLLRRTAFPGGAQAPPPDRQVKLLQEAARALLGEDLVVLPTFTAPAGPDAGPAARFGRPDLLPAGVDANRVRLWWQQVARVHERIEALDDFMLLADAWRQAADPLAPAALRLHVAQLPADSGPWLALDDSERGGSVHDEDRSARNVLAVVAAANTDTIDLSGRAAGLLLDQWEELIPTDRVDTSVAFHFDGPSTQAPQALLLAVPGRRDVGWTADALAGLVVETMDLAKIRAVDAHAMGRHEHDDPDAPGVGAVIPALMLAADPERSNVASDAFKESIDEWVEALTYVPNPCADFELYLAEGSLGPRFDELGFTVESLGQDPPIGPGIGGAYPYPGEGIRFRWQPGADGMILLRLSAPPPFVDPIPPMPTVMAYDAAGGAVEVTEIDSSGFREFRFDMTRAVRLEIVGGEALGQQYWGLASLCLRDTP